MQRLPRFLGTKVSKPKEYDHLEQLKSVAIVATDFLFPFLRGKEILLEEFKEISVGNMWGGTYVNIVQVVGLGEEQCPESLIIIFLLPGKMGNLNLGAEGVGGDSASINS